MFVVSRVGNVPGMIQQKQCDSIKELAKSLPTNAKVLEIGCWMGKSTWSWLDGLHPDSTLITVDPFLLDAKVGKFAKRLDRKWRNNKINEIMNFAIKNGGEATWKQVVENHPNKNVQKGLFRMLSGNFAKENHDTWDCVYIDGDHSWEGVTEDLRNFEPRTNIICGDDYKPEGQSREFKPQPGLVKAVNQMCERTGRTLHWDPDSFFWTAIKHDK